MAKGNGRGRGKKNKDFMSSEDAAPVDAEQGTNTPEDAYKHHLDNFILPAHGRMVQAKEAYQSEQATYRGYLKNAKEQGLDIDAIKLAIKLSTRDAGEVRSEMKNTAMVLRLMGLPLGTQLGLFNDVTATGLEDPDAAGFHAAKNGEPNSNNPYQAGTEEHVAWRAGWERHVEQTFTAAGNGAGLGVGSHPVAN